MNKNIYAAIDLKSFYASVECVERGLDPLTTNLVVADKSRTDKTICLAVTPPLKARGIKGRPRLFEVIQKVNLINSQRKQKLLCCKFAGRSYNDLELQANPALAVDYIVAPPQMAKYIKVSTDIYKIYLKYIAPEDIHVYSVDEVFIYLTPYLPLYKTSAHELVLRMIRDVLTSTGITATAGIGTNMYLAKIAMDIVAKKMLADKDGVRIAALDEKKYRELLWQHKPLTDFWRIGKGYSKKLERHGMFTMGDIARCSIGKNSSFYNEELLYKLFGINAELLIDHAWGYEDCTIEMVKNYRPLNNSLSSGQVLTCPYDSVRAKVVLREMAEGIALDLFSKKLKTDQLVLTIGYDVVNLYEDSNIDYKGAVRIDSYGRKMPVHAHGSSNLGKFTSSAKLIIDEVIKLFDDIVDNSLFIRRITLCVNHVVPEKEANVIESRKEINLFADIEQKDYGQSSASKEEKMQEAVIGIKSKYGKNSILRGTSFIDGATGRERNNQIGGHRA